MSGRRRRSTAVVGLLGSVALAGAACGTSSTSTTSTTAGSSASTAAPSASSTTASGKHFTIALIPGITTDPFYITMERGAEKEAKKLGITLTWQGGTSFSPSSQLPVVQAELAKHPSALLIAPTDTKALINPIKEYISAHIPVISVDTTIADTSILASRITSDNTQGGKAAADAIAKAAHDKGSVAVINVSPGVSTTDARQSGFLNEMKKFPNMKVVATEYDNDSPTKAASQAQALMLAHPHLVGIFGTNLYSAEGAGKAVAAAGKKGKIFIAGYDAEPAEVTLLKQGVINILVVQQPAKEGELGVKYAYDYLTGKKSAITKSVKLPNVIATTATASNPNISKYFYKSTLAH